MREISSARPRVAVVGHIEWVDFVSLPHYPREGDVAHADAWSARVGGGGGVAAVVLAEMGAEVDFFLALGPDAHGKATVHQLEERGVRPHVAWREREMTRRAITYLSTGGERTIVTIGDRLEPRGDDDLEWERLREVDGVYFTAGDLGALARARAARVLTASPRGREALDERDGPRLDALIFSDEDAHEREWAGRLASRTELMVATQGEHGGQWWGPAGEGRWSPVPAPGPACDAYGCGDSFAAAFTYGLAAGGSVPEAARLGAERGALALTRVGAP
jgi:ribokinase